MSESAGRPGWIYWFAASVLIVFGTLTGFSIGLPFLAIGLALVVLAPFTHRTEIFWPVLVALVGFFIGFLLVAPLGCTVSESVEVGGNGEQTSITRAGTSCDNVLGLDYSGGGDYRPSYLPAAGAGLAVAIASGGVAYILQPRRPSGRIRPGAIGWTGVGMHAAWSLFLAGLGLFSEGSLDPQWVTALIFVSLAAFPAALAAVGLRGRPGLLLTAGVLCVPLSFISLAGATLPLLLPATLYLAEYSRTPMTEPRERPPWSVPPPAE